MKKSLVLVGIFFLITTICVHEVKGFVPSQDPTISLEINAVGNPEVDYTIDFVSSVTNEINILISSRIEVTDIDPNITLSLTYEEGMNVSELANSYISVYAAFVQNVAGRDYYVGSVSRESLIQPEYQDNSIIFYISLQGELDRIFSYLLVQNSSILMEDIGYLAEFSLNLGLDNATEVHGNRYSTWFRFACEGGTGQGRLLFVIPDDASFVTFTWESHPMERIGGLIAREKFSIDDEILKGDIFVEWEWAPPPPLIPWWLPVVSFVGGILVTLIGEEIIRDIGKKLKEKRKQASTTEKAISTTP